MKVLLFNGSNREHGCTFTALSEAARILNEEGVETEILQIGAAPVADCIGCRVCAALPTSTVRWVIDLAAWVNASG